MIKWRLVLNQKQITNKCHGNVISWKMLSIVACFRLLMRLSVERNDALEEAKQFAAK